MVANGEKLHYPAVTKLSALFREITSKIMMVFIA